MNEFWLSGNLGFLDFHRIGSVCSCDKGSIASRDLDESEFNLDTDLLGSLKLLDVTKGCDLFGFLRNIRMTLQR